MYLTPNSVHRSREHLLNINIPISRLYKIQQYSSEHLQLKFEMQCKLYKVPGPMIFPGDRVSRGLEEEGVRYLGEGYPGLCPLPRVEATATGHGQYASTMFSCYKLSKIFI